MTKKDFIPKRSFWEKTNCKVLLLLFFNTLSINAFSQQLNNEQSLWAKESFGSIDMQTEVVGLRSEFAKHFKNPNGKMTAVVTAGPLNYFDNGSWQTIYHSILEGNGGFQNVTNRHKTYFPKYSNGNLTTILEDGATITDMIGMQMYYLAGDEKLGMKNIGNTQGQVTFNELTYSDVYGLGIDLRLTQNTTSRKMDYIINNSKALGMIPAKAEFLVFEEKIQLPAGWNATLINNRIELRNGSTLTAFYDMPVFYDSQENIHDDNGNHQHTNEISGTYDILQVGNTLTIKTLVPTSWLKEDLVYPLYIDPNVTLYPANASRWTGHHRTTSTTSCHTDGCANYTSTNITESVEDAFYLGRNSDYQIYNGWIKFDITTIPDDACINSAVLRYNVFENSSASSGCRVLARFRHMTTDPSVNAFDNNGPNNQGRLADIRDGDIYGSFNAAVLTSGTGWHSVNLNSYMNHLQTQLVPNWFAVGLNTYEGASTHYTCRNRIRGYSHSDRPQLIVNYDPPTTTENITICSGELPYNWHGQTITAGGNAVATRMTLGTNGCDLEVTLNLTVNPGTPAQTDNVTICQNALPYNWHGQTITAGGNGVATRTVADANGCNYVTTLNLTVNPTTNTPDNITICQNALPYTWNGQTITAGGNGVATHTSQDANGCNVVTTLNLTVNPTTNTPDNVTICQNALPYTWNGQTITAGGNGVATHTTQDANGCNVVTTLNLTVNPVTNTTDNIAICQNALPYTWNGQTITAGGNGVATHTTQDANGCDVVTTLNLTVNPVTNTTDNIAICQNALPYTWNGQTITAGGNGVATHTSQDANGCDVVTTLNLTINPIANTTDNITICQNALPYTWNGQTITAGGNGVATHTSQDANSCDIVTTLNLTVNPVINTADNITICQNALPYTWNGQTITAGGNAVATHTSQDANGCDVVTTLNLTVNPITNTADNITICQNALPYTWNGQTITAGGNAVATHTVQDANGCDVITTLNLTVNPTTNTTQTIAICQSDLPYSWNGQTVTAGGNGVATHTTQDANGCDVVTTLNLTVNPDQTLTDNIAICSNALPYSWNGQTITAGGNAVATHTTQNANGCDVVTTLNLTVAPVINLTDNITICSNALPYTWNGQTITAGGNGVATHTTQIPGGCNEVTTLNLTISPVTQLTDNITICSSQLPYLWNGQTITIGGNGVATHTTQNANGCDITTTLNLTVTNVPIINFNVNYTPCIPAEVVITPASTQPNLNYTWTMNGVVIGNSNSAFNLNINNAGCYDVALQVSTPDGCTATSTQQPAFCVDQSPIADFTYPGEANSTTTGNVQTANLSSNATSYHWVVSNGASSTEVSPLLPFSGTTGVHSITLYAYSANGCVDSITKTISVKEDIIFYVPNSFTPDGDEFNHSFGPVITSGIDLHNYTFSIYNRWGEMIFESHDASVPWDGTYKGKMVQDGTYTWQLEFLERNTDARHHYVGHVNLIR
jgi:gliding motility-associated-like protein